MKDLRERLAAAGVHTLLAQFTDIDGVAKGKYVPLAHLDELLTDGAGFSGPSIAGTGLPRTGPRSEYWARGYASTTQPMPWAPGYARVVCDGWVAGEPFEACPRQVLKRACARLAEHGWQLRTGIEPEFFLLQRGADDHWRPADDDDRLDKPSYDLKSLPRQAGFLHALQQALQACGLDVLQLDHEDAHGQYEVNFGFDEALASADHLMLFKLAAQALAEARGMAFSLMPKPFADQPGSGMHFHVSLWKGQGVNASNVFVPHAADGSALPTGLSMLGQQFVAGVLAHAPALTALAAPTVNSYKRLAGAPARSGTHWAPASIAHGFNNRTAMVRTLGGRFEWRLPDASTNPYLATAGLIAAGLDGIDRRLALPAAVDDDLFTVSAAERQRRGLGALPADLGQAIRALQADEVVQAALGPVLSTQFIERKQAEWQDWQCHVGEWEWQRYATAF